MITGNQNTDYARGLEGVVAAETRIGFVDGINGRLVYRGYNIEELAESSTFEEVSYLLLYGTLPTKAEFEKFTARLNADNRIDDHLFKALQECTKASHPMSALRTGVSYLGSMDKDSNKYDLPSQEAMGLRLMGKFPSLVAAINRSLQGKPMVRSNEPNYTVRFLEESFGKKPTEFETKVFRTALILHADHGMNASTFASMVTISTLSDMYSAITSAIASLKGPLHGGANEQALANLERIGSPKNADNIISEMLEKKEKIMGFGHRVYKVYDPRAKILKEYAKKLAEETGHSELFETAEEVERVMINKLGTKGIFPNVDFYSGIVYKSLGFDPRLFTPIFALSRISGWFARSFEYLHDNRLFRPRSMYKGEVGPLKYVPLQDRK
ncbi:MAG: citrate synthase/methylcitrate synthase [Candidatus Thermoplasmatota archaeon]|nr:citrate synthase/methylcitrate synthase [Candidatus Thermoplasmatota archaeon]